jgi:hypothetical protein
MTPPAGATDWLLVAAIADAGGDPALAARARAAAGPR